MSRKRYSAEQIIQKLREAEVELRCVRVRRGGHGELVVGELRVGATYEGLLAAPRDQEERDRAEGGQATKGKKRHSRRFSFSNLVPAEIANKNRMLRSAHRAKTARSVCCWGLCGRPSAVKER